MGIVVNGQGQQTCAGTSHKLTACRRSLIHAETINGNLGNIIPLHCSLSIVGQILIQRYKQVSALHCQGLELVIVQLDHIVLIIVSQRAVQTSQSTGAFAHLNIDAVGHALCLIVDFYQFSICILHLCRNIGCSKIDNLSALCFRRQLLLGLTAGKTCGHSQHKRCDNQSLDPSVYMFFHNDFLL